LREDLEENRTKLLLFLRENLIILVNNRDSQQDPSTRTDSAHEVGENRESSNAKTSERSGSRNVTIQAFLQRSFSVSHKHHLLALQLLGDIFSGGSGDFNPGLREEGAGSQDEGEIEYSMERICEDVGESPGWRDVVCQASDGDGLNLISRSGRIMPHAQQIDEEISRESPIEQLREEIQIRHESGLQYDGDVGCVEQLDGI